jgi:hypothetical protein
MISDRRVVTTRVPYPQAACASSDIALGHADSLAVVQRLDRSELISVLLKEVCELHEQAPTVLGSLFPPGALESFACGGYSEVDILLGGLVDRADDALVGGVDDLEGLAVDTFDELVVDEPAGRNSSASGQRSMGTIAASRNSTRWLGPGRATYSPVGCSYSPECGVLSLIDVMLAPFYVKSIQGYQVMSRRRQRRVSLGAAGEG